MIKKLIILLMLVSVNAAIPQSIYKKAPNVKIEDIDGKRIQLKSLTGTGPLLIAFWATWCKPCHDELEEYQKIYELYKNRGLKMAGISTDDEKSVAKVKPVIKAKGFNFPVYLDTNSDAAREFYVRDVPTAFLIDKKGNIVYSHRGYKKGDELELKKRLDELLK